MIDGRRSFGGFSYDPGTRSLAHGDHQVGLRPKVNRLLRLLTDQAEATVDREAIKAALWGESTVVEFDMGISACVRELRQTLEGLKAGSSELISTIPTIGYRLSASVEFEQRRERRWTRRVLLAAFSATVLIAIVALVQTPAGDTAARRMVILPLRDLSVEPIAPGFLASVHEDVMQRLGPLDPGQLAVVPAISVRQLQADTLDAPGLGAAFDAQLALETSARIIDGHLLLTLTLIDTREDMMLWGQILEFAEARPASSEIADRIAALVADAVAIAPTPLLVEPTALDESARSDPGPQP